MIIRDQATLGFAHRSAAIIPQSEPVKTRRQTKSKIKPSIIAIYASVFALVVAMVSIGYSEPKNSSVVVNTASVSSSAQISQTSVDSVVATSVAAGVAQAANLPIANNIANLAISTQVESTIAQSNSINTSKPQIISSGSTTRSVVNYVIADGDTMDSLMAKFSLSKNTIKWANNMVGDSLIVGTILQILPTDGVLYTVKASDTTDSIAAKYGVDKTRLVLFNDLDVSGLVPGNKIVLPGANLPNTERPGYVAPVVINYYAFVGTGLGGQTWNIGYGTGACPTYGWGQCTCYAYSRRHQLGLSVGDHWGNASSWASMAASEGYSVNHVPSVGAIMQNVGGWGHVAIVESVAANGDVSVSEMNAYVSGGGLNVVSGRIIPSGNVSFYNYIH